MDWRGLAVQLRQLRGADQQQHDDTAAVASGGGPWCPAIMGQGRDRRGLAPGVWYAAPLVAHNQFASLLLSCHPRCGILSPARCLSSSSLSSPLPSEPPSSASSSSSTSWLLWMMWDSWVVGVTKWFHVHVTSQEDYGVLAFGVSTTLLGLVGAVKWAGPDAAIEIWDRNRPRHAKVVGCAGKSGHPRGTVFALKTKNDEEEGNGMSLMGGVDDLHIKNCECWDNDRWWVQFPCANKMVILNTADSVGEIREIRRRKRRRTREEGHCGSGECVSVAVVPIPFDGDCVTLVFFNKVERDEAAVVVQSQFAGSEVIVFNIADSFFSGNFTLLSSTQCLAWQSGTGVFSALLFPKKNTGSRVFICPWKEEPSRGEVLAEIEETTGDWRVITTMQNPWHLSHLGGSLFCCSDRWCYEIWDVNNIESAVCKRRHKCGAGMTWAIGGLLLHDSRNTPLVAITEPLSGLCVLQIRFDMWKDTEIGAEIFHL